MISTSEDLPRPDDPADRPVVVASFIDVHLAEFAISVLAGSGIDSFIDPEVLGRFRHLMLAAGGVRLFVRAADAERAVAVLRSSEELGQHVRPDYGES